MQRLCLAFAATMITLAVPATGRAADDDAGFRPLFDGQTLNGWRGEEGVWRVENDAIVGESTVEKPLDHNTFLVWDQGEVDDFELRLQFKLTSENEESANSGIQFRSQINPDGHVVGYQADIDLAGQWVGALYDEHGRKLLARRGESNSVTGDGLIHGREIAKSDELLSQIHKGDWNDYTIIAQGERLTLKINGLVTAEVHDQQATHRDLAGILALQVHSGPAQKIEFRNIRLKRLPLADGRKKVVFIAGQASHGAGQHEHNAGCLLLADLLNRAREAHGTPVIATVYLNGWPKDPTALDNADTVVSYCDGGQRHYLNQHLADFNDLVEQRGIGLVCIHYAVETTQGECGDQFLKWIGGYFEPHWSVNPHWTPSFRSLPDHPIARGVSPFEINDEWYYHMRFQPELQGVTPILTDLPPRETLSRPDGPHSGNPAVREAVLVREEPQHMAWAYERPDGKGRGFGFTGGHFHRNWADDNFRTIVANAILWTANAEVPSTGVPTDTPTQAEMDANLDPKPQEKKSAASKPAPKPTDEHAAANAVANLDVHPDLAASVFAAEPMLLNPTDIDIDHRGRVWVCEVINYRRFANGDKPERQEGDRILILEDTDADGRADKSTTFYQGRDVDSAHGICVLGTPDDKGTRAIVSCGPEVFFLIDDDGDLQADRKEVLFTGIEGTQHDHGIHAFVFGPDGKLYFNFGNAGVRIKDKDGNPITDKAGNVVAADRQPYQEGMVFRCNMDGSEFETFAWNFRNNWEVAVDSFGGLWQSDNDDDGNRGVRINFVMEYGNYGYKDELTGAGWQTPRTGWEAEIPRRHWHLNDPGVIPNLLQTGAGSPTGICVYEGDALPKVFRGALIHTDAGPSICRAYVTKPDGAGYTAEIVNILDGAARDKWFRPSDVCVAPDGSLLVADWYDPGVGGHRMGDVEHGRIFRVTAKEGSGFGIQDSGKGIRYAVPKQDFSTAEGAVEALKSPNLATRYVAYTALQEMGADAEPALVELYGSQNPRHRARALWLLSKLGLPQEQVVSRLKQAAGDTDVDIRCTTIRVARQLSKETTTAVLEQIFHNQESSPAVQREFLIAMRDSKDPRFAQTLAILTAFAGSHDRWYLEALGIAAEGRWDEYFDVVIPYLSQLGAQQARDIVWRSRGKRTPELLAKFIADKQTPDAELPRLFRAFDFQAESPEKSAALNKLAFAPPDRGAELTVFVQAEALQRLKGFDVSAQPERLEALNKVLDASGDSEQFVRLVAKFSVADRYDELLAVARRHASEQVAIEAIRTLLDKGQLSLIRDAVHGDHPETVDQTLAALSTAADARTVDELLAAAADADLSLAVRRSAVRALGSVRTGGLALQTLAESGDYDPLLKEALAATLHTVRWNDIKEQARTLFPLPPGRDSEPVPPIAELVERTGDVARGRIAFHSTGTCAKCHVVNGIGLNIGPELSEIGRKLSKQALLESVLFPSAAISHNYETWVVLDTNGNITTGLLVSETPTEVQIKDEKGLVRTIAHSDIEERAKQPISLMPADLQKILSVQELVDIVEYMTTLQQAPPAAAGN